MWQIASVFVSLICFTHFNRFEFQLVACWDLSLARKKPARSKNTSGIASSGVCATQTCATATLHGFQQKSRCCTHTSLQVCPEEAAAENRTTIYVINHKTVQSWFTVSPFMPFLWAEATKTVMVVVLSSICIIIIAIGWIKSKFF